MRNSEGRNYYSHDETGHFTFEKPRLPDILPAGWVAVKDTHGETNYVNKITNTTSHVSPIFGVAPEGWDLNQTKAGRLFYVNRQTHVATWHKPEADDGDPLPSGWERGRHADGRVYYIDHVTKTNTWTRPTAPAVEPPSLGNSPSLTSTHGLQSTMPTSTTTRAHSVMNPAQPAVRLPVAVPTTNGQNFGSLGTLQGSATLVPPQTAPQMAGQNSVIVISAPQMTGQGPVTVITTPQTTGQRSVQVPLTQFAQPQGAVTYPSSSQSATAGSTLSTLANNPQIQKAAIHLGVAAVTDSTTHSFSQPVSSGHTASHANIGSSQISSNGTAAGLSYPSNGVPPSTENSSLQYQGNSGVGNTSPATWNAPSNQSTVSTHYGSFSTSEAQNNGNVAYANSPPAYMPTVADDASASIVSSMANLMNSNESQNQYSNNLNPSTTSYIMAGNSALTPPYYVVPQETYVQTQDVQTVQVSSNGTSGFTDYATTQTLIADCSQDVSVNTDYFGDTAITDLI
ncbi:hypothetical protein MMC07_006152 [Pseudocyphellaria aurata]|nr:hypothetical protein [Pseudocyphellaria aurata]